MNIRAQAAADLAVILGADEAGGNGEPITVTTPTGLRLKVTGRTQDISQTIDPETGMMVSGKLASVAIRIAAFGIYGVPKSIPDNDKKPWLVEFADLAGKIKVFKVAESKPDDTVGLVVLILEPYKFE